VSTRGVRRSHRPVAEHGREPRLRVRRARTSQILSSTSPAGSGRTWLGSCQSGRHRITPRVADVAHVRARCLTPDAEGSLAREHGRCETAPRRANGAPRAKDDLCCRPRAPGNAHAMPARDTQAHRGEQTCLVEEPQRTPTARPRRKQVARAAASRAYASRRARKGKIPRKTSNNQADALLAADAPLQARPWPRDMRPRPGFGDHPPLESSTLPRRHLARLAESHVHGPVAGCTTHRLRVRRVALAVVHLGTARKRATTYARVSWRLGYRERRGGKRERFVCVVVGAARPATRDSRRRPAMAIVLSDGRKGTGLFPDEVQRFSGGDARFDEQDRDIAGHGLPQLKPSPGRQEPELFTAERDARNDV